MLNAKDILDNSTSQPFEVLDTFNNNMLAGYLCRQQGDLYGSLLINKINNEETEQVIYGTPKLHYPFDKNGKFNNNLDFTECLWFEKLDGTNILGFAYKHENKTYVTYKTRLTPVVKDMKFGNFKQMLEEMLLRYPEIPKLITLERSLSFELYGALNKHLILYPFRLDLSFLFFINQLTGEANPPNLLEHTLSIPQLYSARIDFIPYYNTLRNKLEAENRWENEELIGSEGSVVYSKDNSGWKLWKLKPETVASIHMKPGLSAEDIIVTCKNALEHSDELTYEVVKELLLEEITEWEIEKRKEIIEKCITKVLEEQKFIKEVSEYYKKAKILTGQTILTNKREIMRFLSQFFAKQQMQSVYTYTVALEK